MKWLEGRRSQERKVAEVGEGKKGAYPAGHVLVCNYKKKIVKVKK